MRKTIVLMLALCFTSTCFAKGIPCEKLEYAELKDMDKPSLAISFCDYKRRTDSNQKMVSQYEDFSFMQDAEICLNEMLKVGKIYKKAFGEFPPECE